MSLIREFHLRLGESHYQDLLWLQKEIGASQSSIVRQALRKWRKELELEKKSYQPRKGTRARDVDNED